MMIDAYIANFLWISWGYVHDLRMMLQLAMALKVCRITCFQQNSKGCQASGGLTGHEWRSDWCWEIGQTGLHEMLSFGAGPKIEGVGK